MALITARSVGYPYATFDLCQQTGSDVYQPTAEDEVVLGETWWTWDDDVSCADATPLSHSTSARRAAQMLIGS